jgi:hypothetical protein
LLGGGAVSTAAGLLVQAERKMAVATAANFRPVENFIIERHSNKCFVPNARGT